MPGRDLYPITDPLRRHRHPALSVVTTRTSLAVDHVGVPVMLGTGADGDLGASVALIVIKDNCTLFQFTNTDKQIPWGFDDILGIIFFSSP